MTVSYQISARVMSQRQLLRSIARAILKVFARLQVTGMENIPSEGSYVVAFNHVSNFDAPVLIAVWPAFLEALGAEYLWTKPILSIFIKMYRAIRIQRGDIDREAIEKILQALRNGYPVMISPEGTRSHQPGMQEGKPGVVYIVERTKSRVVPVGVVGTTEGLLSAMLHGKRPVVEVHIGESFSIPDLGSADQAPKEIRQMKVDFIMRRIADQLPSEYQGVYAQDPNSGKP